MAGNVGLLLPLGGQAGVFAGLRPASSAAHAAAPSAPSPAADMQQQPAQAASSARQEAIKSSGSLPAMTRCLSFTER